MKLNYEKDPPPEKENSNNELNLGGDSDDEDDECGGGNKNAGHFFNGTQMTASTCSSTQKMGPNGS